MSINRRTLRQELQLHGDASVDRGWTTGRNWTLNHLPDRICLLCTIGQQQAMTGFHDGGNAHRHHMARDFLQFVKVD